jgi:hypothetical protein
VTKNKNERAWHRRGFLRCMAWVGTGVILLDPSTDDRTGRGPLSARRRILKIWGGRATRKYEIYLDNKRWNVFALSTWRCLA